MNEKFTTLAEKRGSYLRLRAIGVLFIMLALLGVRWFTYYRLEPFVIFPLLFVGEFLVFWLLLRRLKGHADQPRSLLLLRIAGQLQVFIELLLLTGIVYFTGGITSLLLPLFFIYVFADGLVSSERTLVLHAAFAFLLLLCVTLGTFYGWLERYDIGSLAETELWRTPSFVSGALVVFGCMMAVTLYVAITFSRRTAEREH